MSADQQAAKVSKDAFRVPKALDLESVPLKAVLVTGLVSAIAIAGSVLQDFPLWGVVGLGVLPWIPLFTFEAAWKYENYGTYALLAVFTILQIGHLGEHSAQVLQLLIYDGDVTRASGVFGALDREWVHFVWDSGVWVGVLWLFYKFGTRNKWLWIALVAATFHEVEHTFLIYLAEFATPFYDAGGTTGILAKGGLFGTPFARPYLHYIYNFFVVVPLIVALLDETKYAYNEYLARALPDLTEQERVSTTSQLDRLKVEAGHTIVRQGETADSFFIVGDGEVEVIHELDGSEERVAILGPGQVFGEIGLLLGKPRSATVRATKESELLWLDRSEFQNLVSRSSGGAANLDSVMRARTGQQAGDGQPTPAGG